MFDKFGNMESYKNINELAANLKAEGDKDSLMELAKENGIDKEDARDFLDGSLQELCTPLSAALGKLEVEEKELKPKDIMRDWVNYIKSVCQQEYIAYMDKETATTPACLGVRKKDRSLKGCIGALLKWSHDNMRDIDPGIKKAAGFTGNVKLGIPDSLTARHIIREYYLGGK